MERVLAAIRQFFAHLFPPIEQPALTPLRGRRAHTTSAVVQDFIEGGYHGNPEEDDKWPDQGSKP